MSRFCVSIKPVGGRAWRVGHPFSPRMGRLRRLAMAMTLLLLGGMIFGYVYLTDSNRVRAMAETYLSQFIGGRVRVHSATLSVFEGLRLEGVSVYVDDKNAPDSLVFSAQAFVLKYDPTKIVRGELEAAQIVAEKPHVHLTENLDAHEWNFERMFRRPSTTTSRPAPNPPAPPAPPGKPPPLPAVLLRNARVEISELRNGRLRVTGYQAADGQILPLATAGMFAFELQTRGAQGIGPWARGTASIAGGPIDAELHDFDFGRDVRSMLWNNVREFWERHAMSGRIDVVRVHFQPGDGPAMPRFRAEMALKDINLSVPPDDWFSPDEIHRRSQLREGVGAMQALYRAAGYRLPGATRHREDDPDIDVAVPGSPADVLAALTGSAAIQLRKGSGEFVFSDQGVEVRNVTGRVEGNAFVINGQLHGYSPDAPFVVTLQSPNGDTIKIPSRPRYLSSMPSIVRDIYTMVKPDGICTVNVRVERSTAPSPLKIAGEVNVLDGVVSSIFFPYPLRQTHGRIAFGYDARARADFVHVIGMRGRGIAGGPNQDNWIEVNGDVGPLDVPDPHVVIRVHGDSISSEPTLLHAFPPEVRQPLSIFDAEGHGEFPTFHGSFSTVVLHEANWGWRWSFDTDLHLDDASGKLVGFPYFLDHVQADVQVRDGYCNIINARSRQGAASLLVNGKVTWTPLQPPTAPPVPPNITTDVQVSVRNLPIDRKLLDALPPEDATWIKRIGLSGILNVDGRVYQGLLDPTRPTATIDPDEVRFDLAMSLSDGTLWPSEGTFSVSDLRAKAHLTPEGIEILDSHGRRGQGDADADGAIRWGGSAPELALHVNARKLPLDGALYAMLPEEARRPWDEIQPRGAIDADVSLRMPLTGVMDVNHPATRPSTAPGSPFGPPTVPATRNGLADDPPAKTVIGPTTAPIDEAAPMQAFSRIAPGFNGVLRPHGLVCMLRSLPYRVSDVEGVIRISPEKVVIERIAGRHGNASFIGSGTGSVEQRSTWDLKLSARDLPIDTELRAALPSSLISVMDAVKLRGNIDLDFTKFVYRADTADSPIRPSTVPAGKPRETRPTTMPSPNPRIDVDLAADVLLKKCTIDAGVPMTDIDGKLKVAATARDGRVGMVRGDLELSSLSIAGRQARDLKLAMRKPADRQEVFIEKIHGDLAGGQVAGDVQLAFPDDGPSRYLLSLVVRNADLETLIHDASKDLRGDLTASLSLEGDWEDAGKRRGRGDMIVSGKALYHLPLIMGLFQVTNLSLPIATPFKTGSARYSIEGPRVNFERVELKSDNMQMTGGGTLDYKTKKVLMTFTTDNPSNFKVPFINDLIKGARNELMKITIKGSIQEPQVEANPFGTFTTTIDEVFKK